MLCLKEPSLPLRRVALSCFGSVGKHDQQLAEMVQKEGAVEAAVGMLGHRDPLLRRHACRLLALCCQHDAQCAGWIPQKAQKLLVSGVSALALTLTPTLTPTPTPTPPQTPTPTPTLTLSLGGFGGRRSVARRRTVADPETGEVGVEVEVDGQGVAGSRDRMT